MHLEKEHSRASVWKEWRSRQTFYEGAKRGYQDITGLYCEHPVITSVEYAVGLYASWNNGEPNQAFQFLLGQADQGDLEASQKEIMRMGTIQTSVKPLMKHSRLPQLPGKKTLSLR